jgi:hypothetical protein
MPSIPQRSRLDEDIWLTEFNKRAENNQSLVDSLCLDYFRPVIEAVSLNNTEYKLVTLASIYKFIDSDEAACEGLKDFIELLELENEKFDKYIGKSIGEFPFISTRLVDEYLLLQAHARKVTDIEAKFCAVLTWSSRFPAGFQCLLRVKAVHARRINHLKTERDMLISGRLTYSKCDIMELIRWDNDDTWRHGCGYERAPMSGGLADFIPPSLTKCAPATALDYIRSSAFLRSERRRSALVRLSSDMGGLSDFHAPGFVDAWYHGFAEWLTSTLPTLYKTNPTYAAQLIDVGNELKAMHHRWTAEVEYQGYRFLITKNACFSLSKDKTSVRREAGRFALPTRHTPICVELDQER